MMYHQRLICTANSVDQECGKKIGRIIKIFQHKTKLEDMTISTKININL